MRRLLLSAALLSFGCGGGSGPTAPQPPPAPTTVTVSGYVLTTLTNAPIAGATLAFSGNTVTSGPDGAWTLPNQTRNATLSVEVSAPGYLTRNTTIRTEEGRGDVAIDLIKNAAPFSLGFFRQIARDAKDNPGTFAAIRRWTQAPIFHINTHDSRTGGTLSAKDVASIRASLIAAVPQATGGTFSVASITTGPGSAQASGVVNVELFTDIVGACGTGTVGANPGLIRLNTACGCGGFAVSPEVTAHETGHAMGLLHAVGGIMDDKRVKGCTNTTFSAAERYHAKIAYARPVGNMDIDRDGVGTALFSTARARPFVQCYR